MFQAGAKPDDSAGCSTPTDAKSAGVDPKTKASNGRTERSKQNRTVCTTSGAEGVGAKDKPKKDEAKKSASAPSNTSAQPR